MQLPSLVLGKKTVPTPIIQGGMGIGISLGNLAGHVAKEGGVGIISTAQIGCHLPEFARNPLKANLKAIGLELKKARHIAKDGLVGFNVMASTFHYEKYIEACLKEEPDVLISGGGLPIHLPAITKNFKTLIAPIISSKKAGQILLNYWDKHYGTTADFLVVEGPKAGGHLGFKENQLMDSTFDMEEELGKIITLVKKFEEKFQRKIPVIFAGGVFTHEDIHHYLNLGCQGVQIATRFVVTDECEAPDKFKQAYLAAKKEDLKIIKSPVGLPARAIANAFTKEAEKGQIPIEKCRNCLAFNHCDRKTIPYCISQHLLKSADETPTPGLVFAGENVYRIKQLTTVKDLMTELRGNISLA